MMDHRTHLLVQEQRHHIGRGHLLPSRAAGPCTRLRRELTNPLRHILRSTDNRSRAALHWPLHSLACICAQAAGLEG